MPYYLKGEAKVRGCQAGAQVLIGFLGTVTKQTPGRTS